MDYVEPHDLAVHSVPPKLVLQVLQPRALPLSPGFGVTGVLVNGFPDVGTLIFPAPRTELYLGLSST